MEAAAQAASVEEQLDALEAAGARSYDAPACDCVRTLLDRADDLGGAVGARLRQRADAHVASLAERFRRDGARVQAKLSEAEQVRGELAELRQRAARGELTSVARTLRRLRTRPLARVQASAAAQESGGQPRGPSRAATPMSQRRRRVVAYEDSVAQMVAALALARANDVVPEDAGPYNPLRIASEVLDRMREVSPFFLAVQLNRLEELGSLLNLPEPPPPPAAEKKVLPKRKPGAKR